MAELAARQHGVVARRQLAALGVGDDVLRRWLERQRLFRVQPSVFSLTPYVLPRARMLAAALTYGPEAALSYRASAGIWDVGPWPTGLIDVTVPRNARPRGERECT